jgi:hypothetical protein
MLGWFFPVHQRRDGGQEIIGHGAADTAVCQFHDIVFFTARHPAFPIFPAHSVITKESLAVESKIAELIDDKGQPPTFRAHDKVADEGSFSGAEEARDDGCLNLHIIPSLKLGP